MSKYTTEVRFICEHYAGLEESKGYGNIAEIIQDAIPKVFDFDYPIFDESYRNVLETKILKHYYLREICTETVGIWKHFLNTRLNEIMPYYNKLYNSELIEFNPLYDVDLTTDHNRDLKATGTENIEGEYSETNQGEFSESNSTSVDETDTISGNHWDMYQDTPQGGLINVQQEDYLTNARHITDSNSNVIDRNQTSETTGENENTRSGSNTNERTRNLRDLEDYLEHVKGKRGSTSNSKLLQEFRETFLNIDVMIINDLKDLFFNLW